MRELRTALEPLTVVAMSQALSDGASSRMTDVTRTVVLIIPTLNEAASIGAVVRSIPRDVVGRCAPYAVNVHVKDFEFTRRDALVGFTLAGAALGSDDTGECAQRSGAEVLDVGRGYGRACLLATQAATDADIVVFMDGDGADDVQAIRSLVDPIRSGAADFVIGSRVRGEREPGSMSWHQVAAGVLAGFGMKLLYGVRYTDMCAFRAIRRDALLALGMSEMTYGWNIEMQMRAARSGLRIVEIPVPYHRRTGGSSKVAGSLGGTIRAGTRIISTFVRVATQAGPQSDAKRKHLGAA